MFQQNFEKSSDSFLEKDIRNIVLNFELSVSSGLRRGTLAILQVDIFQNP